MTAPATPTPLDVLTACGHIYNGRCPDLIDRARRDPLCPMCQALATVAALVDAALAQDPPASAALAKARADYLAWRPDAGGGEGE